MAKQVFLQLLSAELLNAAENWLLGYFARMFFK
jgi:hypothetical protein